MNEEKLKPRRYFIFRNDIKSTGSVIADSYRTFTFTDPPGHHFYLGGIKVAYYPLEIVNWVTSLELEDEPEGAK